MHRLDASDLRTLKVRPHVRRLVECAWRLGGDRRPRASCGCGAGRTRSGSADTASPRAAATPPPSPRSAERDTSTPSAAPTTAKPRDPWGRPLERRQQRRAAPLGLHRLRTHSRRRHLARRNRRDARRRTPTRRARGAADQRAAPAEPGHDRPPEPATSAIVTGRRARGRAGHPRRNDPALPRRGPNPRAAHARHAVAHCVPAQRRRGGVGLRSTSSRSRGAAGMSEQHGGDPRTGDGHARRARARRAEPGDDRPARRPRGRSARAAPSDCRGAAADRSRSGGGRGHASGDGAQGDP